MTIKPDNCPHRWRRQVLLGAVASAFAVPALHAGTSTNTTGPVQQGQSDNGTGNPALNNPALTITLSGSTAMRNFTVSPYITLLNPGTSIALSNGTGGAVTWYGAPDSGTTSVQLASSNFTIPDSNSSGTVPYNFVNSSTGLHDPSLAPVTQNNSAIRMEWHEQGSVEGILEMANDQIGYLQSGAGSGPLIPLDSRNPTLGAPIAGSNPQTYAKFSNPVWVNQNAFDGTTTSKAVGATNGAGSSQNGFFLARSDYNTYSASTYNTAGTNLQGGMNRVQMAISDVNAIQGFSISGASGAIGSTPLIAGYGKGNSAIGLKTGSLSTSAPATPGALWQLQDQSVLNMSTDKVNPQTGTNYAAGAWNNAGVGNLDSRRVAVTATLFVANPGTGLTQLNRTDAQWLQSTGRLANGADFNMTTRDVGSGTRNVAALNTGVDPSWAVGENDSGNGYNLTPGQDAQAQLDVGNQMRFSNKSAGGQLRATVQNNRMAIGTLGMSDAINDANNGSVSPIRALKYSDSLDGSKSYVQASASSITDGSYVIYQNEQYVTVKAPDSSYGTANSNIKGDNANGDVASFRGNVLTTVKDFPASSIGNAADGLLSKSFILPQMMQLEKTYDGVGVQTSNAVSSGGNYDANLRTAFLGSSYAAKFNPADPSSVTSGAASAKYGNAGDNSAAFNGAISITPQNYLFANFNQNGVRDFNAVKVALYAQQALQSHGASSLTADGGDGNATAVLVANPADTNVSVAALNTMNSGAAATKGDLIVMGDFNGDGKFDGKDIYLMARGASLSDGVGTDRLTTASGATFADQIRNGISRKNAALDYVQAHANAQQRIDARAIYTDQYGITHDNDPAGINAFNKMDVNRDGHFNLYDAAIVDAFSGQSYANVSNVLNARLAVADNGAADGSPYSAGHINGVGVAMGTPAAAGSTFTRPVDLLDVKVADDGSTVIGRGDFDLLSAALGSQLLKGDANFDGHVDFTDLSILLQNYGVATSRWGLGNFENTATIGFNDLSDLLQNYGGTASGPLIASAALANDPRAMALLAADGFTVTPAPEPGTLSLLGLGALGLLARRRRCR